MTSDQLAAFCTATHDASCSGAGMTAASTDLTSPEGVKFVVVALCATLVLIWAAMSVLAHYRLWSRGELDFNDLMVSAVRACAVIMVIGFFVR
ncbi:MAG: TIGR03758 family integrating conjugative element protein [Gammaproteobacteria bacterium]|nr:TIGR03758 family integrating conjugative element protein [Gammaproteobacteria bacterium]